MTRTKNFKTYAFIALVALTTLIGVLNPVLTYACSGSMGHSGC